MGCSAALYQSFAFYRFCLGELVRTFEGGHYSQRDTTAAFIYGGDYIIAGDERANQILVWSRLSGEIVRTVPGILLTLV